MRAWIPFAVGLSIGLGGGLVLGTRLQSGRETSAPGTEGGQRDAVETAALERGATPLATPASGSAGNSLSGDVRELHRALDDTQRTVLALLEELRARPTNAASTRTPLAAADGTGAGAEESPEVTLPMLYEELRGLRFLVAPDAGPQDVSTRVLEAMQDPNHGIDWGAWQPILDLWEHDRAEARSKVKLMTEEQVLQRFGPPSDVWSNTQGITWQYARGVGADGQGHELEILLRIPNGYVTQLVVR